MVDIFNLNMPVVKELEKKKKTSKKEKKKSLCIITNRFDKDVMHYHIVCV